MDSKDNKEEKTREVAEIRMYHFSWNFLQLGYDMLYVVIVVDMKIFYTFNMCATLQCNAMQCIEAMFFWSTTPSRARTSQR